MKRLVEFLLEDGTAILVEVDDTGPTSGVKRSLQVSDVAERAKQTFEAALDRIRPAANSIISRLRNLADSPDQIEVTFSIKLTADVGAILASAGVEANYLVKLTWKRQETKQNGP